MSIITDDRLHRDLHITTQQGRVSPSQLYTLADIELLANTFADDPERGDAGRLAVQITLGKFVEWLREREKEGLR